VPEERQILRGIARGQQFEKPRFRRTTQVRPVLAIVTPEFMPISLEPMGVWIPALQRPARNRKATVRGFMDAVLLSLCSPNTAYPHFNIAQTALEDLWPNRTIGRALGKRAAAENLSSGRESVTVPEVERMRLAVIIAILLTGCLGNGLSRIRDGPRIDLTGVRRKKSYCPTDPVVDQQSVVLNDQGSGTDSSAGVLPA
jgi:hypothetical protein